MKVALIACKECGKQISTDAYACPHCGAKQRAHWAWALVLVPVLVLLVLYIYGLTIPAYEREALRRREMCEHLIGGRGTMRQSECDRTYADDIAKGKAADARQQ